MYKFDMTKFSSIYISRFYSKLSRSHSIFYRIRGVMVSVLASSVVDREFESRSGQTKDYIKLLFAASPAQQTGYPGNRLTCPCGLTFLSADCCFSELALY